jgi:hypothetical protein
MFICAKYGLNDKEYFLNTNCSSAVLSDYVQERTVRDTRQALEERREQEKKEKGRVVKVTQAQKRALDGMVLEFRDLEKAPTEGAAAEAAQQRKTFLEEDIERKKKDMENLEGERKAREDALKDLEEKLDIVAKIKRVELVEDGGGPVVLKEPDQKHGGDIAAKFLAPRSTVKVRAYADNEEEEGGEKAFDLSFDIPPIESAEIEG